MEKITVLHVAAENDALPGAKVGGVGDVMRDLPQALSQVGANCLTALPSYGFLARLEGNKKHSEVEVDFAGKLHQVEIYRREDAGVEHFIFHHSHFFSQGEQIYIDDGEGRAFASDATKFAFFSACVAQAILQEKLTRPDFVHCHDWHTAFLLVLLEYDRDYAMLNDIKTVYTIHNLALQGIRPLDGDESSFHHWFPDLNVDATVVGDPRYRDCINPTRAAILLANRVHTVSPTYAREILTPSVPERGVYGGEGLETDLQYRTSQGELVGILNGCDYPQGYRAYRSSRAELAQCTMNSLVQWGVQEATLASAHWLAEKRIASWYKRKDEKFVLTSVGRLTDQKVRILRTELANGKTVLQALLDVLADHGSLFMLGTGAPDIEAFVAQTSADNANLIFLKGYSAAMSQALFESGDLFLMPSSFEPCGISQMLALRAGQPCLVNKVGGLQDTIRHKENGYLFSGATEREQGAALVEALGEMITLFLEEPEKWAALRASAAQSRFTWEESARNYMKFLYQ